MCDLFIMLCVSFCLVFFLFFGFLRFDVVSFSRFAFCFCLLVAFLSFFASLLSRFCASLLGRSSAFLLVFFHPHPSGLVLLRFCPVRPSSFFIVA